MNLVWWWNIMMLIGIAVVVSFIAGVVVGRSIEREHSTVAHPVMSGAESAQSVASVNTKDGVQWKGDE